MAKKIVRKTQGIGADDKRIKISAYSVEKKIRKQAGRALEFSSLEIDDTDFQNLSRKDIITPPFDPKWLALLVSHNNTLNQCITAMEVNVDGSGFAIEPKDSINDLLSEGENTALEDEVNREIEFAHDFFDEVAPGISFLSLRRELRRDLESTGNAYMEVIRSLDGKVSALKHIPSHTMRLVRLGDPVEIEHVFTRGGKDVTVKMFARQRVFVQVVGSKAIYFKEYGAQRHLNRDTGEWEGTAQDSGDEAASTVPPMKRATEVVRFIVDRDATSSYGVPRWINNIPSVLGSRKAEEENLTFFDFGGVPPVIITLMGGTFVNDVETQLRKFFESEKSKNRVLILEAESSEGAIDTNSSSFKIDVQRFGSEKQKDSLFENYDQNCSERVRSSFRFSPLFLGRVKEFNFATAFTAYLIAESQVFQPERKEFDEIVNNTIIKGLGFKHVKFRSLPISLKDQKLQLEGLKVAKDARLLSPEQIVEAINEITNLNLQIDPEFFEEFEVPDEDEAENTPPDDEGEIDSTTDNPQANQPNSPVRKKSVSQPVETLIEIADNMISLHINQDDYEPDFRKDTYKKFNSLVDRDKDYVCDLIAYKLFDNVGLDKEGASTLVHSCINHLEPQ